MFDVVIGNPPYQSENSSILYDKYILGVKKLKPDTFSFVVPPNWITGNASSFKEIRKFLLSKNRLRVLCDYVNSSDVFPIKLDCGVCYFLYDKHYSGKCRVTTNLLGNSTVSNRTLDAKSPIRFAKAASILSKVTCAKEFASFSSLVKSSPFQIDKSKIGPVDTKDTVTLYKSYKRVANIPLDAVVGGKQYVNSWKVFLSKVYGDLDFPRRILPNPIVGGPGSVCSQSYLFIGPLASEAEATGYRPLHENTIFSVFDLNA